MAKETYYFSHDSNAITDTKILNMRCDYGLEGYGLYWAIIEMMRNEEDYKLELNKNAYRAIKTLTNTTIDVEKYIHDCINDYGLFKEENEKFFSNSLLRRMLEYERKKEINRENGKLGGRPKKTEEKPNANPIETEKNQNKVKESKGKENKINKSKEKESKNISNGVEVLEVWESQFNQFYEEYPKKVKKQDVKKWFQKNKPSNELFSSMLHSLERFRASKDWQKDGGQFIPYPSTWLNQKRWEDEDVEQSKPFSALQRAWNKEVENE